MKKLLLTITLLSAFNLLLVTFQLIQCNQIIENAHKSRENLQKEIQNATIYLNKYFKYDKIDL